MTEHDVASADELAPGDALVVELEGKEIGVFNVDGEYRALLNWCAHQGGPVCEGSLGGTYEAEFDRESLELRGRWARDGEVLSCPWHGWEYDVGTGECLSRGDVAIPTYPARVEDGRVIVDLGDAGT